MDGTPVFRVACALLLLLLLGGCGTSGGGSAAGSDSKTGGVDDCTSGDDSWSWGVAPGQGEWIVGSGHYVSCEADPDPCATGTCFTVCGTFVQVHPPAALEGFDAATPLPLQHPMDFGRTSQALVTLEHPHLVLRDTDSLAELGALFLGWHNYVAVTEGLALVNTLNRGGIQVVDLSDPTQPAAMARWRVAAPPPGAEEGSGTGLWLVGAAEGLVIVETGLGVSLLDVSDPQAPVEAACIPHGASELAIHEKTDGRWLVVQRIDIEDWAYGASVYDLDASEPTKEVAKLPATPETFMELHQGRLLLFTEDDDQARLYELDTEGGPALVATRPVKKAPPWIAPVVGGFALMGDYHGFAGETGVEEALDLEGDDLGVYTVHPVEGSPCLQRMVPAAGGPEWLVSPHYVPDTRWSADAPPVHACPPAHPNPEAKASPIRFYDGIVSPDGAEVLAWSDVGVYLVSTTNGETTPVQNLPLVYYGPYGSLLPQAWVGDRIAFLVALQGKKTEPGDSLVEVRLREALDAVEVVVDSPGPVLDAVLGGTMLYAISEPEERASGSEPPPPEELVLWAVDLAADDPARIDLSFPATTKPVGLAAWGDLVYVLEKELGVHVLDSAGTLLSTVAAGSDEIDGAYAAGPEGLLLRGEDGVLRWLPVDGEALLEDIAGCTEAAPIAALQEGFYLSARTPSGEVPESFWELRVATPSPAGDGFALEVTARAPFESEAYAVRPGMKTAVFGMNLVALQ